MTDFNKNFKKFLLKENNELEETKSAKPIPFNKLLNLVKKSYGESMGDEDEFEDVENIEDLVNVLYEMGFKGDETYKMILDSIYPKQFTFSQILQLVKASYSEMDGDVSELRDIKNIPDLVNTLDEMGFNGEEAFEFIFDSIIDESSMMQESENKLENLNPDSDFNAEMIERMEGLVNSSELRELQNMLRIVSTSWMDDGFDKEDIKTYINDYIDNI